MVLDKEMIYTLPIISRNRLGRKLFSTLEVFYEIPPVSYRIVLYRTDFFSPAHPGEIIAHHSVTQRNGVYFPHSPQALALVII